MPAVIAHRVIVRVMMRSVCCMVLQLAGMDRVRQVVGERSDDAADDPADDKQKSSM